MTSRVLDCDHVFEALTRGPFPAGCDDDALVDSHLETCHECRRLAEALRPAVDLMHEALGEEALPQYEGQLPPASESSVAMVMERVRAAECEVAAAPTIRRRVDPLSVVAAVIVGLVLGVLLASPGDSLVQPKDAQAAVHQPDSAGRALLTELRLAKACREELSLTPPAAPKTAGFTCCTRCHHYQHHGESKMASMTQLLQGCRACHDPA